jgi:hypothetical protein
LPREPPTIPIPTSLTRIPLLHLTPLELTGRQTLTLSAPCFFVCSRFTFIFYLFYFIYFLVSSNSNNMRSYTLLVFALCSVFSFSAAQTASATTGSTVEATTAEATTGVTTNPAPTISSGGGAASDTTSTATATASDGGGGTGTTSTTSAGSSSTKGPPDVLLKVPNLSVKKIEYAILDP